MELLGYKIGFEEPRLVTRGNQETMEIGVRLYTLPLEEEV